MFTKPKSKIENMQSEIYFGMRICAIQFAVDRQGSLFKLQLQLHQPLNANAN